ncbi:hypothetical protein V6N13_036769 [Hibiscus sabdariffa]
METEGSNWVAKCLVIGGGDTYESMVRRYVSEYCSCVGIVGSGGGTSHDLMCNCANSDTVVSSEDNQGEIDKLQSV